MNGVKLVKKEWRNWPYKNTTYLILSLVVFFYFLEDGFIQSIIKEIGSFGYLGALITGIFFVSAFTIAPAVVVLYDLAEVLNPFYLAVFAGIGAVVGDWLIFRFLINLAALGSKNCFIRHTLFGYCRFLAPLLLLHRCRMKLALVY